MSAAVEEVARNAVYTSEQSQSTAISAHEGNSQVSHTLTAIEQLSATIHSTSGEVQELADKAQRISSVLDVIRAVADQTNLLALNAAIEAARAGEHGRGFAVVADEVRALAHRTQQSTAEIEEMISNIQQGTERTVAAMEISNTMASGTQEQSQKASEAFARVSTAVNEINERNLVIASAAEEQAQVAQEVDRNLVNIRDLSTQSAAGAEQTSASSRELSRLAVELNELVTRFQT
ncbi:methyl-accepting chemotaxis protein [Pseudomonas sp. FME51]|uniref:methyl-accepting chemotaxis protein n=1 Tax=Pseudomonas sp. FME51 TaxID=2742609 RepID=UPI0039AF3737